MATSINGNLATTSPGNTIPARKARDWQITLNETFKWDDLREYLIGLKSLTYIIACKEIAPTTGHEHIHVYTQYKTPIKLSIKKLQGAHVEACKGTPQQNVEYIKKDGNIIFENGTLRKNGKLPTIKEAINMTDDELMELPLNYQNTVDKIITKRNDENNFFAMLESIKNDELKAPEIIYIIGLPGNGKTYGAYKQALSKYDIHDIGRITIDNNFFAIENDKAKCFVIEEFRPSQLHPSKLLQLTDKYGYQAPIKGGFKYLRPETIYICSVKNPIHLYEKDELNEQFTRRITHYYHADDKVLNEITIEDLSIYDY